MLIRYAEITDFCWLIEHDQHISDETLKIKIDNKEIYIIQEENKIIGLLRYNLFWDNIPFMNLLLILEEYQNKGYGKKLVKYWEEKMKRNGYNNVLTSTQSNENAQHFYRKIGYIEIGGLKYLDDPYEIIFYKNIGH
ncbi:N-acetyltransferase [Spirochaetia bacterium]|nr:N-acetyltransferase [Spirochaetia bacterium]